MNRSTWWTIGGVAALIAGALCLFRPFEGSLAATAIAGWAFSFIGLLQIIAVILVPGTGNKVLLAILGVISTYLGWTILANPLDGVLSLTLAAGLLIAANGVMRLFVALDFRGAPTFWALLLSAVVSIALGVMILGNFPQSAASILGILLGVQLIFDGAWLLGLGAIGRRVDGALRGA